MKPEQNWADLRVDPAVEAEDHSRRRWQGSHVGQEARLSIVEQLDLLPRHGLLGLRVPGQLAIPLQRAQGTCSMPKTGLSRRGACGIS